MVRMRESVVRTCSQSRYTPSFEDTYLVTAGNKVEWTKGLSMWNIEAEIMIFLLAPCLAIDNDNCHWKMRKTEIT